MRVFFQAFSENSINKQCLYCLIAQLFASELPASGPSSQLCQILSSVLTHIFLPFLCLTFWAGKYGCFISFFHSLSVIYLDCKPFSEQGAPTFLPLHTWLYLASQIKVMGNNRKSVEVELGAAAIPDRCPSYAWSSYVSYTMIKKNFILHKWELEMAFIDPMVVLCSESRNASVSSHEEPFLIKSASSFTACDRKCT